MDAALRQLGFNLVETADNVSDAMKHISTSEPPVGLVLSDLNMPGVDGLELLKRFDEIAYCGDILLISGEDSQTLKMAESLARARGLSVIGAMSKPIQIDTLSEILSKLSSPCYKNEKKQSARRVTLTPVILESAIKLGDIKPWFQPKIDIATRMPVGVEVLARWPESPLGPIFPDIFIPVAEEHGLIDKLTFSLVEQTIKTNKLWHRQGIELELAFNISMNSLYDESFPDTLERHVLTANGSMDQIKLEVTESQLMEDLVRPLESLLRLRMKKVKLSIDDFGTGHSNLRQLRDLPFDELKLDRSYVHSSGNGERTGLILESTVEMAKKLDMSIVAEGVETSKIGCELNDLVATWCRATILPNPCRAKRHRTGLPHGQPLEISCSKTSSIYTGLTQILSPLITFSRSIIRWAITSVSTCPFCNSFIPVLAYKSSNNTIPVLICLIGTRCPTSVSTAGSSLAASSGSRCSSLHSASITFRSVFTCR
jgi:EAL domain-containing protein (putative c-di-GMP-specific phosphodiesterase class I)